MGRTFTIVKIFVGCGLTLFALVADILLGVEWMNGYESRMNKCSSIVDKDLNLEDRYVDGIVIIALGAFGFLFSICLLALEAAGLDDDSDNNNDKDNDSGLCCLKFCNLAVSEIIPSFIILTVYSGNEHYVLSTIAYISLIKDIIMIVLKFVWICATISQSQSSDNSSAQASSTGCVFCVYLALFIVLALGIQSSVSDTGYTINSLIYDIEITSNDFSSLISDGASSSDAIYNKNTSKCSNIGDESMWLYVADGDGSVDDDSYIFRCYSKRQQEYDMWYYDTELGYNKEKAFAECEYGYFDNQGSCCGLDQTYCEFTIKPGKCAYLSQWNDGSVDNTYSRWDFNCSTLPFIVCLDYVNFQSVLEFNLFT